MTKKKDEPQILQPGSALNIGAQLSEIAQRMSSKRYWAHRIEGDAHVTKIVDGRMYELPLRLDVMNTSPDGFEWGYAGGGPHQLALALCIDALGGNERGADPAIVQRARNIYAFIVPQLSSRRGPQHKNDEWCATVEEVLGWITRAEQIVNKPGEECKPC